MHGRALQPCRGGGPDYRRVRNDQGGVVAPKGSECTCPGKDELRDIELRIKQGIDAPKAEQAEVFRDIDIGVGKSADEIQRKIVSASRADGYEPPSDYSRWSRFLSAGSGRRGTRTARLLAETARGLKSARKKAARSDDRGEAESQVRRLDGEDTHAAKELRSFRRAFATYAALAVSAVAGAYFTKGIAHIVLTIVAVLLAAIAAWVGLWTLGMGVLTSVIRGRPGRRRE